MELKPKQVSEQPIAQELMPKPYRRSPVFFLRTLLVNKPCQLLILAYSLAMMFLTAIILLALVFVYQGSTSDKEFLKAVFPIAFCLFLIAFLGGFWLSNKIVGPIYQMEKHMQAVLDDQSVVELKIRSGDQFQMTAQLYNRILKKFGKVRES